MDAVVGGNGQQRPTAGASPMPTLSESSGPLSNSRRVNSMNPNANTDGKEVTELERNLQKR